MSVNAGQPSIQHNILVVVLLTAFLRGGGEIGAPASLRFLGGLFVAIVRLQKAQETLMYDFVCRIRGKGRNNSI